MLFGGIMNYQGDPADWMVEDGFGGGSASLPELLALIPSFSLTKVESTGRNGGEGIYDIIFNAPAILAYCKVVGDVNSIHTSAVRNPIAPGMGMLGVISGVISQVMVGWNFARMSKLVARNPLPFEGVLRISLSVKKERGPVRVMCITCTTPLGISIFDSVEVTLTKSPGEEW